MEIRSLTLHWLSEGRCNKRTVSVFQVAKLNVSLRFSILYDALFPSNLCYVKPHNVCATISFSCLIIEIKDKCKGLDDRVLTEMFSVTDR